MAKFLKIIPSGRLGGLMFQFMFAKALARLVPGLQISGVDFDVWGLFDDPSVIFPDDIDTNRTIRLHGHQYDIAKIARLLNEDRVDLIELAGWACRVDYYEDRSFFAALFTPPQDYSQHGYTDEYLVIHIRAEDIVPRHHPDYMPTPIPFIRSVIQETGLVPIFMGQIEDDWYSQQIREEFADATFLKRGDVISDFELIRNSRTVMISASTFSWLATWLSDSNKNIYMPILGSFNPAQRPDINLVPKNDQRYHFYQFPVIKWRGDPQQIRNPRFKKTNYRSIKRQETKGRLLQLGRTVFPPYS